MKPDEQRQHGLKGRRGAQPMERGWGCGGRGLPETKTPSKFREVVAREKLNSFREATRGSGLSFWGDR